tara:strand:+ start:4449 stop:5174 length:726 start_codon:yes stop_codon:yes gene_type:complete
MNPIFVNAFNDELEKISSASTWGKRTSRKVRKYLADVSGKRESDAAKKTYETFYRESKAKGGPGYERAARRHKAAVRLQRMAKASKIKARKQTALGAAGLTAGVGGAYAIDKRASTSGEFEKIGYLKKIVDPLLTKKGKLAVLSSAAAMGGGYGYKKGDKERPLKRADRAFSGAAGAAIGTAAGAEAARRALVSKQFGRILSKAPPRTLHAILPAALGLTASGGVAGYKALTYRKPKRKKK